MDSSWIWVLIVYLIFSLLLGEGLIYHCKKANVPVKKHEYLLILFLGPFMLILMLVINSLRKGPK
jgi:hypothetical protein